MSLDTTTDVAVCGVRVATPVTRTGGAGPSDDVHVTIDGLNATLPVNPHSPYLVRHGRLWRDDTDVGLSVGVVPRPKFYDMVTADGVPYHKIALLHGADVLASTVVQTCVRYEPRQRCRFCAIEESLRSGATVAAKTPAELAEVAEAAVWLDGIRQLVLTTGTTAGPDRGARHLARCVRAVLDVVPDLPIGVQCEPPAEIGALAALRAAGAAAVGIHVESLDERIRRRWTPGKARIPIAGYEAAWDEAVSLFGRNRVSTYLLIGLGEDPDDLVAGAARLIDRGVYPFVVPFRPLSGTLARRDGIPAPPPSLVRDVTSRVAALLRAAGITGADQRAGCAACGACGALRAAGG